MAKNKPTARKKKSSLFALETLKIKCTGITPLLCANPADMMPEMDSSGRAPIKKAKTPEEICRTATYFDTDGHCAFPNAALYSAIYTAASLMKLKMGSGTYAKTVLAVIDEGMQFDHNHRLVKLIHPKTGKPLTEKDYEIDMQRAVNQNTGGAIVAIRPRFDEWAIVFHLLVDSQNANLMAVIERYLVDILAYTGMSVALGAYRAYVEKKGKNKKSPGGPYGKFVGEVVT